MTYLAQNVAVYATSVQYISEGPERGWGTTAFLPFVQRIKYFFLNVATVFPFQTLSCVKGKVQMCLQRNLRVVIYMHGEASKLFVLYRLWKVHAYVSN